MNQRYISNKMTHDKIHQAALIGGISLLLVALLAGFSQFIVLDNLVTMAKAEQTAKNILTSQNMFISGIVTFALVAVLDMVVAWSLFSFFSQMYKKMSIVMALTRIIYAVMLLIATVYLLFAFRHFSSGDIEQAMQQLVNFHSIWEVGLILFGVHLILVGYLSFKVNYSPKWLGILLILAGVGYFIDNIGLLVVNNSLGLTSFVFIGEVALLVWLLVKGRHVIVNNQMSQKIE